jgi:hypothetical protein
MSQRMSDRELERLHAGELSAAQAEDAMARLRQEPGGLARLDALRQDDERTQQTHPAQEVAAEVVRRLRVRQAAGEVRTSAPNAWQWLGALVPVAAVVLLVLAVDPPGLRGDADNEPEAPALPLPTLPDAQAGLDPSASRGEDRTKGLQPRLKIWRKAGERADLLANGAKVQKGDVIQVAYVAGGRRHGAVLSIDGRGNVMLHLPTHGKPAELQPQGEHALPQAYELDDAPGFERFFLVASDQALDAMQLLGAAHRLANDAKVARTGRLAIGGVAEQDSLLLVKP